MSKIKKEIHEKSKTCHTLVITSEHFSSRLINPSEILALRTFLSSFSQTVDVIGYIRDAKKVILPLYSTMLKGSFSGSFNDFLRTINLNSCYWDFNRLRGLWLSEFSNFQLLPFSRESFFNQDVFQDFIFRVLALDIDYSELVFDRYSNSNASLSLSGIKFHYYLNKSMSFLPFPLCRIIKRVVVILTDRYLTCGGNFNLADLNCDKELLIKIDKELGIMQDLFIGNEPQFKSLLNNR